MSDATPAKRMGCAGWVVVVGIFGVLMAIGFAVLDSRAPLSPIQSKGQQIRALGQAKQVGLALRLYAGDHDGRYPVSSALAADGTYQGMAEGSATDSNAAFRPLIPDYVPGERIFALEGSPWTPPRLDEGVAAGQTLAPGENHWSYVPGLAESSPPDFPLVAEGFAFGRPGLYTEEALTRTLPRRWVAKSVVVIRNDQSAALERLVPRGDGFIVVRQPREGERTPTRPENLFSPRSNGGQWIPRPPVNPLPPPIAK